MPAVQQEQAGLGIQALIARRAERLGKSVDELLQDDRKALREAAYPGPQCLTPYEVESFSRLELAPHRMKHADTCPMCAALLQTAEPTEAAATEFLKIVQRTLPAQADATSIMGAAKRPLSYVVLAQALVLLFLFCLLGAGFVIADHDVASTLIPLAERVGVAVIVGAVVTSAIVILTPRFEFGRRKAFQTFGGLAIGSAFAIASVAACFVAIVAASRSYKNIATSRDVLISALADREAGKLAVWTSTPEVKVIAPARTAFSSFVKAPIGKIVAKAQDDNFQLSWSDTALADTTSNRTLGTIYKGTYLGEQQVVINGKGKVSAEPGAIDQVIEPGTRVLALMSSDGRKASRIIPID